MSTASRRDIRVQNDSGLRFKRTNRACRFRATSLRGFDDSADRSVVAPLLEQGPAVEVVRTAGRQGPAAARNAGWRASQAPFIAFLDDDVVPEADWAAGLPISVDGFLTKRYRKG